MSYRNASHAVAAVVEEETAAAAVEWGRFFVSQQIKWVFLVRHHPLNKKRHDTFAYTECYYESPAI